MRPRVAGAADTRGATPLSRPEAWLVDLRRPAPASLRSLLTEEELARVDRPPLEVVRRRNLVTRAAVRTILAGYLDCAPLDLVFGEGHNGKPWVAGIEFNLSHTEGLALVAVASRRVGVDVELVRPRARWPEIARGNFTAVECAAVTDIEGFLRVWTRKEAFIKALGDGLQRPLDSFNVTVDGPAALLDAPAWAMVDVPVPRGYLAALVVEGPAAPVRVRRWSFTGPASARRAAAG